MGSEGAAWVLPGGCPGAARGRRAAGILPIGVCPRCPGFRHSPNSYCSGPSPIVTLPIVPCFYLLPIVSFTNAPATLSKVVGRLYFPAAFLPWPEAQSAKPRHYHHITTNTGSPSSIPSINTFTSPSSNIFYRQSLTRSQYCSRRLLCILPPSTDKFPFLPSC